MTLCLRLEVILLRLTQWATKSAQVDNRLARGTITDDSTPYRYLQKGAPVKNGLRSVPHAQSWTR